MRGHAVDFNEAVTCVCVCVCVCVCMFHRTGCLAAACVLSHWAGHEGGEQGAFP